MFGFAAVGRVVLFVVAILAAAGTVGAHVMLDDPNGGEVLGAGTSAVIEWHVLIGHATINWDLWYSVTGPSGPWIEIAVDLPPGNTASGAIHTFDWLVPAVEADQVRVRVRQDNSGTDYEDVSDADFTITATIFEDGFESGSVGAWSDATP